RVEKIALLASFDERALLEAAASVEHQSEHPLAAAIVHAAKERDVVLKDARDFQSVAGNGAGGRVDGKIVLVGKRNFLDDAGVKNLDAIPISKNVATEIFVAIGGEAAGAIALTDPIKESTPQAVEELHALGLKLFLATGDNEAT